MEVEYSKEISVVMSVYSEPESVLRKSIESILDQTFKDFEFIIINDSPSNEVNNKIINEYSAKDERIKAINNKKNIGLTQSLNKGISVANGNFVARMDADDYSYPKRFERQVNFLKNNSDVIVCGTNVRLFGDEITPRIKSYPKNSKDCKNFLFFNSCFAHPTVMLRKNVLQDNNMAYNEQYRSSQDFDLWCRLSEYGAFYNLQEVLLDYRVSERQISSLSSGEQFDNARKIRRNYFIAECNKDVSQKIMKEDITLNLIQTFKIESQNPWCLFSLYMSVNRKRILTIIYFIISLDFFKLPLRYSLIIIKNLSLAIIDKSSQKTLL